MSVMGCLCLMSVIVCRLGIWLNSLSMLLLVVLCGSVGVGMSIFLVIVLVGCIVCVMLGNIVMCGVWIVLCVVGVIICDGCVFGWLSRKFCM